MQWSKLEDADWYVRYNALLKALGKLEPETLAQYAAEVIARLEDTEYVCMAALHTLDKLEPATLAQHSDAVVNMLDNPRDLTCEYALMTLGKLDPATLALHANAVIAMLKDDARSVRAKALNTICKLDQATLTQHADAVVAMLKDTTDVGRVQVRGAALAPLRALPHYIIRGIDFDDLRKRALAAKNARELFRDSREFEVLHSQLLGRLRWYRCRIRWRVQRLVLYWYALPYRPSGPGHARDVEAWDRMVGSRDERQTTSTSSAKKRQIEITDWLLGSAASRTSTNLAKRDRRHQAQK